MILQVGHKLKMKTMNFDPFPEIRTERLVLRELKESDWNIISYLRSDELVNKFVKRPKAENKKEALKFIHKINMGIHNQELICWSITLKDNSEMVGTISLWNFSKDRKTAEVGYDLNPKFQRRGIMTEALKEIIDFGFKKLGFHKIEAFTHRNNESSKRLLNKNEFYLIEDRKDEDNIDNIIFEIEKPITNNA